MRAVASPAGGRSREPGADIHAESGLLSFWRKPMIGLAVRYSIVCGALLLPMTRGAAVELEIGSRFPAEPSEKIVVKNDASVRNETASFAFGEVRYSSDQFRT